MTMLLRLALLIAAVAPVAPVAAQSPRPEPLAQLRPASHVVIPQARSFALAPAPASWQAVIDIESVAARVRLHGRTAATTLDIVLRNTSSTQDEAVLLLPVPDDAVISGFALEGSTSGASAEVLKRDDARALYDAIVAKLRDPALLEFSGYDLVRSSVFPVPPGGTQKIRLTYESLLEGDGDRIDYVLPRSEALDGRRPWTIAVDVKADAPISTLYSPTHALVEQRVSDRHLTAQLDERARLEPGSFRLSYLLDQGDAISASLLAYPDEEVGGGYFLLMAGLPATLEREATTLRREVTLVIDRSGSMAGVKMDQARAAARQVIGGLDDGDAFNVVDYSSGVSTFAPAPVAKGLRSTAAVREYVAAIRPGGGTNIHAALRTALLQPATPGTIPIVLFLTDGLPTIGKTSEIEIRRMVEEENPHGRRVFTFGVGEDVNAPLLDRVADVTRATATYVMPDEDVELKVAQVFRRLAGPVLAAPKLETLDTSGANSTRLVRELIPDPLPDLFRGDQLVVLGQYRGDDPITFRIRGDFLGTVRDFDFTFDLSGAATSNAFVPRLWASRRIAFLVDEIRQAGAASALQPSVVGAGLLHDPRSQELVDEILRLSTRFGILTEYTAFLAREGTNLADAAGLRVGCSAVLADRAVRTRSGVGAVNQAVNYRKQRGQAVLNYGNAFFDQDLQRVEFTAVQQLCDRAFFRRGNRWIDSRLIEFAELVQPAETIMIGSPRHEALLRRLVLEGRQGVLSLRGEILLEVDGQAVLVTDGC